MTDSALIAYVRAASAVLGLALDDERVQRVAHHLARTAAMARQLDAFPLQDDDEPAQLFQPAPFPCAGSEFLR